MPTPATFASALLAYLDKARRAQAENTHHDYRRSLFLDFLREVFGVEIGEIAIEKFLKIDRRQHGWVDAVFRNLVFEFKRDLEKERADGLRELLDYLRTLPHGRESIGLLTDGLCFEAYVLNGEPLALRKTDEVNLAALDTEAAFLWLDSYLFSQRNVPPTSADLVRRFGANSPTFQTAARELMDLLTKVTDAPSLQIKKQQWRLVLAKAYGSDIGSDELFVNHTYLSQFAKLLAYTAFLGIPHSDEALRQVVDGSAFQNLNVANLGEMDFFSWILEPADVWKKALPMLHLMAESIAVYDLTHIDEDLFKQLYQNLIDPETRHNLGEYYTPAWLAELVLEEIKYQPGQSLLDPACGSGTFLFSAIHRLIQQGMSGWELVDFALDNIAGMDVHPLAVQIARINYLLAIRPHMRGKRAKQEYGLVNLPIYMADALVTPEEHGTEETLSVPVNLDRPDDEYFVIPASAAEDTATFNRIVGLMESYVSVALAKQAERPENPDLLETVQTTEFIEMVKSLVKNQRNGIAESGVGMYWGQNLRLFTRLVRDKRNSIWTYILQNLPRPLLFSLRKFDVVIGNPPWLSYRYLRHRGYQHEVRELTINRYKLIEGRDTQLFTQLELSTLFAAHCEHLYLKPGGTLAFVMPRSVITGAKQHRAFQARGLTRVLDLLGVFPLFNVPSAVIIRQSGNIQADEVPTSHYQGRLPQHEMTLAEARPYLVHAEKTTRLLGEVTVAGAYYYDLFKNGATLVPRTLCFVRPFEDISLGDAPVNPTMYTDPDVQSDAKAPWKGIEVTGRVYPPNLYATLLSKNLLPFGYRRLHLVALPIQVTNSGTLEVVDTQYFAESGRPDSWVTWFLPVDRKWRELKKDTSLFEHLIDNLNYLSKLTNQQTRGVYKVVYNGSGVHLAACIMDTHGTSPEVYNYPTQAFIADHKTYAFDTHDQNEAHYLCALLNAPCVDEAIKPHQSRGTGGERDIHRTPFEACAVPPFDPANADHLELARLSRESHEIVAGLTLTGGVVKARSRVREAVKAQLAAIDGLARRVLGL